MAAPRYTAVRDKVVAAVDKQFAENMLFTPKASSSQYGAPVDDATRDGFEIEGILRTKGKDNDTGGDRRNFQSRVKAEGATLSIDHKLVPAGIEFKKHDQFKALDRPGNPVFEVLKTDDRKITRLVIYLGETK